MTEPTDEKSRVVHIATRQAYVPPVPMEPLAEGMPDENALEHLTMTTSLMQEGLVEGLLSIVFDREDGTPHVEICLAPGRPTATAAMILIGALEVAKERLLDIVAMADLDMVEEQDFDDDE